VPGEHPVAAKNISASGIYEWYPNRYGLKYQLKMEMNSNRIALYSG